MPFSGYHKLIFVIIAIAFFFDSVDLGTMTFVLGSIKKEFGLSTATAGLVASASFFGMVLGAAIAGLLADRFGRRPVFQWIRRKSSSLYSFLSKAYERFSPNQNLPKTH
ncbi:hypothetical protein WS72_24220 [Burkholderia savannae]|uniref:Major facilitator superfamily (MFS) profile domain-containing protein n=1 Tax=Burkholderia savannae TaxID=1637837 RepID=A0ABR5T592_9BURK|nr:hypothetical protein WS72_24220 [Burkholderia savannae]